MKNEYFNQRIKCTVNSCSYYDEKNCKCTLGAITVGNSKQNKTQCENYKEID